MTMRKLFRQLPLACICAVVAVMTVAAQNATVTDTSRTTVKKEGATTTTKTVATSRKTIADTDGTTTTIDAKDTSVDNVTKGHVGQTDNGLEGGAARSHEETRVRTAETGNAEEGDIGSTELQNGQTVAEGSAEVHVEVGAENELGSVRGKVEAGANGQVQVGDNGIEASFHVGLAAELEAASKAFGVGDENTGASAQVSAKVEALIGAQGKIGAYIDEKGITLGAEAKAGAYVSAQAELNFEAHFFGVQTNVRAYAEGHAGVLARGEAVVTIGWDGRIKFKLGAGLAIGLGFSAGVEFDVDASELLNQLNLPDLASLLEWIDKFQKDPSATLAELVEQAKNAAIEQGLRLVDEAIEELADVAQEVWDQLTEWEPAIKILPESFPDSQQNLPNPGAQLDQTVPPNTPPERPRHRPPSPPEPGADDAYKRHEQYKTWSE